MINLESTYDELPSSSLSAGGFPNTFSYDKCFMCEDARRSCGDDPTGVWCGLCIPEAMGDETIGEGPRELRRRSNLFGVLEPGVMASFLTVEKSVSIIGGRLGLPGSMTVVVTAGEAALFELSVSSCSRLSTRSFRFAEKVCARNGVSAGN